MTTVTPDDRKAMGLCMFLDNVSHLSVADSRFYCKQSIFEFCELICLRNLGVSETSLEDILQDEDILDISMLSVLRKYKLQYIIPDDDLLQENPR